MFRSALFAASLAIASLVFAGEVAPPAAGAKAPAFSLSNQEGKTVSLDDFRGKWVVLYFYPKDFTGGCTIEAHNFQRDLDQYTKLNAAVVGVSLDTVDSHKGFCEKEGLNFKLLSDEKHVVAEQYGSTMMHDGTMYAARNTFLIDPKGVIQRAYIMVDPKTHSEQVLADLAALQAR